MRTVAGPAGICRGTVSVAVSAFASSVTRAVCTVPPASIVASMNSISAACSVTAAAAISAEHGWFRGRGTWPSQDPAANHSV